MIEQNTVLDDFLELIVSCKLSYDVYVDMRLALDHSRASDFVSKNNCLKSLLASVNLSQENWRLIS